MTTNKSLKSSRRSAFKGSLVGDSSGFTLLETMVAIAILLVAVVSPISLIGDSLHNLYFARDQMTAINLAQEGIEVVRNKRDSNLLTGASVLWGDGIAAGTYILDAQTMSLYAPSDTRVYQYVDGYYGQREAVVGTATTQFYRTVEIIDVTPHEKQIISTVTWMTGGHQGSTSVTGYLFNWLPI